MESGKNENKRDRKQKKAAVQNQSTAAFSQVLGWLDAGSDYSSTTSSTSIGHAFAQIPQAIHLEAGLPSGYDDQAEGTSLGTFAAAGTFLLVDHVNALGVLGDRTFRTSLGAFAALRTGHRDGQPSFLTICMTCFVRIKLLIKCLGTGLYTGKTCHTGAALFSLSVSSYQIILRNVCNRSYVFFYSNTDEKNSQYITKRFDKIITD